jgi:hypothetical protein
VWDAIALRHRIQRRRIHIAHGLELKEIVPFGKKWEVHHLRDAAAANDANLECVSQ